ncbi:hypothetical protein CH381_01710 [Leptospira sp. mixed culture ATI2-C-A1]|nr:hypothetical protein CH381_01710 [Leptospira sp. mixed culture ATI2-C-A1]
MKFRAAPALNWVVEVGLVGFFPKSKPNRFSFFFQQTPKIPKFFLPFCSCFVPVGLLIHQLT